MAFAVEVAEKAKGHVLVGSRWVDTDTPAGAMAVELNSSNFKGLANNPEYTWGKAAKLYSDKSHVGTSACGTAASTFPDTLRIPIEGVIVAPKTPPKAKAAPKAKTAPKPKAAPKPKTAPKKKATPSVALRKIKDLGGKKVKATKRDTVYAQVLAHSGNGQLKKILALYGYTHPAPKKDGKQPNAAVTQAALRAELRGFWGM